MVLKRNSTKNKTKNPKPFAWYTFNYAPFLTDSSPNTSYNPYDMYKEEYFRPETMSNGCLDRKLGPNHGPKEKIN